MWQIAVAAAVAGSGLLAKHLFTASHPDTRPPSPAPESPKANEQDETLTSSPPSPVSVTPPAPICCPDRTGGEADRSVFRFSSSDSGGSRSAFKFGPKKPRVSAKPFRASKARTASGFSKGNAEQGKRGGGRGGRKRVPSIRRVSLFFKKRKTGNNCTGKRDFSCSTDIPSFGWGLGIGMMYMMSTGKEEISKLSDAVDETAKVVHELKTELCRRRSRHRPSSVSPNGYMQGRGQGDNAVGRLKVGPSDTQAMSSPGVEDGEGASSILTEELLPEGMEMDLLEAELESELQKLPSLVHQSLDERRITRDSSESRPFYEPECQTSAFFNPHGVSPTVLSEKLSDVLIQQQGNHISELESELKLAYSKLQQKESELDALKDCIKRLTNFSLSTTSDEEADTCLEQSLIIQ